MPKSRTAFAALTCLLAWQNVAAAQTQAPQAEPGVTTEDCQVSPTPEAGSSATAPPAAGNDLSATLDKCNGVLQPPATGDGEIREAPPAAGNTPVIPPGALPEQPPVNAPPTDGGDQS